MACHRVRTGLAVALLAGSMTAVPLRAADAPARANPTAVGSETFPFADGPAQPDVETLSLYECPEWFRDAKFGIRVQWGPQSVPEQGPNYARDLHLPGRRAHDYHVAHYGPPESVGYDAVIAAWTAEKFDPVALAQRFATAGARYVVALAADQDGFDLWNSTRRDRNAVQLGPRRDIVGAWAEAVRAQNLPFGVSEHTAFDEALVAPEDRQLWYDRVHELVDRYRPELVYAVHADPSAVATRHLMAHFYNRSIEWHDDLTAVFTARAPADAAWAAMGVPTIERGSLAAIAATPWQCDTALNDWVYDRDLAMRPAGLIIRQLADVVSKNGNLLLNVPLRGDGTLPDAAGVVLDEIGAWLQVNGEAIFGTRPWHVWGEGPTETVAGPLGENKTLPYTAGDVRFTRKVWMDDGEERETLYAILLGWPGPGEEVILGAFASGANARPIGTVRLLGHAGALRMVRDRHGLHIQLPAEPPSPHAIVFRID